MFSTVKASAATTTADLVYRWSSAPCAGRGTSITYTGGVGGGGECGAGRACIGLKSHNNDRNVLWRVDQGRKSLRKSDRVINLEGTKATEREAALDKNDRGESAELHDRRD